MFAASKQLLHEIIPQDSPREEALSLRLSAAVLLMEVMRASDGLSGPEKRAASRALAEQFGLGEPETQVLLQQAEHESRAAYDYFRFTNPLDEQLTQERKRALVEAMWRVAYADG